MNRYNPAEYWEKRLSKRFSLRGVGHQSYSLFYNQWLYRRKAQVLNTIFRDTNLEQKSVLDIGAGTGFFIAWYKDRDANATGIDISPTAVDRLKKQFPEAVFFKADFTTARPLPIHTYDIINAWDVIYHQPKEPDFRQFLTNVAAFCKMGGYFICSDGFGLPAPLSPAPHVKFRNSDVYQAIMPALGFKLVGRYPLYNYLNRSVKKNKPIRYGYQVLAPILFWLDSRQHHPASDNLSVSVWLKEQEGELL